LFLAEPDRTAYDLHFKIFGVPVRVHPLFWLISLFMGAGEGVPAKATLLWVAVSFVSILIHELGHAAAILYFGWRPRVTLYGLGGLASYNPGFSDNYESYSGNATRPAAQIAIALAGPAAGFLFAAIVVGLVYLSGNQVLFSFGGNLGIDWDVVGLQSVYAAVMIHFLIQINLFWGLINLLPIYPLDGGQVSRELFTMSEPRRGMEWSLMLSMAVGAAVAVYAAFVLKSFFTAFLLGYLAFVSYQTLQRLRQSGGYGGGYEGGGYGGGGGYGNSSYDDEPRSGRGRW